jgi:predicted DNA binding CopG/RHH family protein
VTLETRTQRFNFRLSEQDRRRLERQAETRGLKPSQYLRMILAQVEKADQAEGKPKMPWER